MEDFEYHDDRVSFSSSLKAHDFQGMQSIVVVEVRDGANFGGE